MTQSAPSEVDYCSRCGHKMATRQVGDKLRRACPDCGFIHFTDPKVGVGVIVIHHNQILLVKRAMQPERGKWSIPAGYLDLGENPQLTAMREVLEETGIRTTIDGLVDVFYNGEQGQMGATIFILYHGQYQEGEVQAGDDAAEARFFSPDDVPELAFSSTRYAVARWLEQQPQDDSH